MNKSPKTRPKTEKNNGACSIFQAPPATGVYLSTSGESNRKAFGANRRSVDVCGFCLAFLAWKVGTGSTGGSFKRRFVTWFQTQILKRFVLFASLGLLGSVNSHTESCQHCSMCSMSMDRPDDGNFPKRHRLGQVGTIDWNVLQAVALIAPFNRHTYNS